VKRIGAGVFAAAVLAAASAAAQGAGRPRDEAFKMIDAYVVSNLQDSLGLTDEQFGKVVPLVRRLQKSRRELAQSRFAALQEMRRLLGSGNATEAKVIDALRALRTAETEERAGVQRDLEALEAALTPLQQAKYRLMEVEVERKIRALMEQFRAQRAPARNRRLLPQAQP
jgi:Spy/CpxP family protein refolding chaperone